jgi:hypothetical protein
MRFSFMRKLYREIIQENEIFQNYLSTMVHGRQWGFQHDISVKITHVITEEEMKGKHYLVKKTTPSATPNWKVGSLWKLYSKTSVAS